MKRSDHLYKYGIVIEYNSLNTIKGKGSAIFIHIERSAGAPTAGCIAVSEENIINLIKWINPNKKPTIEINHINNIPILNSIL
jgi:L,D-peptidoglycan transpeptidase YkuD (ErfK/YbiS/YcfS/YnhG family)